MGTGQGTTKTASGEFVWTIVFDRKLPDHEAEYITANPEEIYQILKPTTNVIELGEDAAAPTGAIMNQFQTSNLGADLFNGTLS